MEEGREYRRLVEVKLNALGVNPVMALPNSAVAAAISPASATEVKP